MRKARAKYKRLEKTRIVVTRTPRHFTATVIDPAGKVLASSTTKKTGVIAKGSTGGCAAASTIGKLVGDEIKKLKLDSLVLDRSGLVYHGRVKAFAEALRKSGVQI